MQAVCIDFERLAGIFRKCAVHGKEEHGSKYCYTSIDSLDELLDRPEEVGAFSERMAFGQRGRLLLVSCRSRGMDVVLLCLGRGMFISSV